MRGLQILRSDKGRGAGVGHWRSRGITLWTQEIPREENNMTTSAACAEIDLFNRIVRVIYQGQLQQHPQGQEDISIVWHWPLTHSEATNPKDHQGSSKNSFRADDHAGVKLNKDAIRSEVDKAQAVFTQMRKVYVCVRCAMKDFEWGESNWLTFITQVKVWSLSRLSPLFTFTFSSTTRSQHCSSSSR